MSSASFDPKEQAQVLLTLLPKQLVIRYDLAVNDSVEHLFVEIFCLRATQDFIRGDLLRIKTSVYLNSDVSKQFQLDTELRMREDSSKIFGLLRTTCEDWNKVNTARDRSKAFFLAAAPFVGITREGGFGSPGRKEPATKFMLYHGLLLDRFMNHASRLREFSTIDPSVNERLEMYDLLVRRFNAFTTQAQHASRK